MASGDNVDVIEIVESSFGPRPDRSPGGDHGADDSADEDREYLSILPLYLSLSLSLSSRAQEARTLPISLGLRFTLRYGASLLRDYREGRYSRSNITSVTSPRLIDGHNASHCPDVASPSLSSLSFAPVAFPSPETIELL